MYTGWKRLMGSQRQRYSYIKTAKRAILLFDRWNRPFQYLSHSIALLQYTIDSAKGEERYDQ